MEFGSTLTTYGSGTVALLQSPHHLLETPLWRSFGTRTEHLGIQLVDEGRMQTELRFGT